MTNIIVFASVITYFVAMFIAVFVILGRNHRQFKESVAEIEEVVKESKEALGFFCIEPYCTNWTSDLVNPAPCPRHGDILLHHAGTITMISAFLVNESTVRILGTSEEFVAWTEGKQFNSPNQAVHAYNRTRTPFVGYLHTGGTHGNSNSRSKHV